MGLAGSEILMTIRLIYIEKPGDWDSLEDKWDRADLGEIFQSALPCN